MPIPFMLAVAGNPGPPRIDPASPASHDLMPAPASLFWRQGALVVDARLTVAAVGSVDARVEAALRRIVARIEALLGARLSSTAVAPRKAALLLECRGAGAAVQKVAEDESYVLQVTPAQAHLTAPNPLGVLRGAETLLQLLRRGAEGWVVPAVVVDDFPRFPWRGLLLDPSRRWLPPSVIERNLDGMAAVKMNVLHWHLADDQGFRVESRLFPELHGRGSEGLFYTQEQVRGVVDYAWARGIRVVPELDVPGHTTSWLVGHPELGTAPGPYALQSSWGIFDPVLDPTREEVYELLEALFGELAALFPDPCFHIGGDEVSPRHWNQDAQTQRFLYEHGLRSGHELQTRFNTRVQEILARHGKRLVGWDEVLSPRLARDAVIQSWRGAEALSQATADGYDVVRSHGYYLDHMLAAEAHYGVDPLPPVTDLSAEQHERVLGGEACMWGEFVSPETIDSRIWPRLAAVAERLWSPADTRDTEDMYRRLAVQSQRLELVGLTHQSGPAAMLRRLTAPEAIDALTVLAEAVEPVKLYERGKSRVYTTKTPLDRLVDAVRPESDVARLFCKLVARLLAPHAGADAAALRELLIRWEANHRDLDPHLASAPHTYELRTLSRDLSDLGRVGREALELIAAGRPPEPAWAHAARALVQAARIPRAELEIAVVSAIGDLVTAATRVEPTRAGHRRSR